MTPSEKAGLRTQERAEDADPADSQDERETRKLNASGGRGEALNGQLAYNAGLRERARHSKAAAIKLFCRQCVCVGEGGTTQDIRNCTSPECALYDVRPYQVRA